jgi:5-methylcytosine-specific restriction endonuclease McrA
MKENQLRIIWKKTQGHCHFCGDPIVFGRRGWKEGDLFGYWEVDHIIQRGKGGNKSIENCLPACTRCNRLRWHRSGEKIRELLLLGLIAKDEIKQKSKIGKALDESRKRRLLLNIKRRKIKRL